MPGRLINDGLNKIDLTWIRSYVPTFELLFYTCHAIDYMF
jgi:hypothetical protein